MPYQEPMWPAGFLWHIVVTRELQGSLLPRWYLGLSYYDYERDAGHYYVIPVNLLVALARWCWFGLCFHWPQALTIPEHWRKRLRP